MFKNTGENILPTELNYTLISLLSSNVKVLIVGGGRAGFIKAKSFSSSGCNVWVVARDFCEDFKILSSFDNVTLLCSSYNFEFILDKHIVVIATGNKEIDNTIASDCEKHAKLFLFCSDFKKGNMVKPLQRQTESTIFALHSKSGNPNASIFTAGLIEERIKKYDDFINYIGSLRCRIKDKDYKDELMKFVSSKDFHFFYKNDAADTVLRLFYSNEGKEE